MKVSLYGNSWDRRETLSLGCSWGAFSYTPLSNSTHNFLEIPPPLSPPEPTHSLDDSTCALHTSVDLNHYKPLVFSILLKTKIVFAIPITNKFYNIRYTHIFTYISLGETETQEFSIYLK